MEVRAPQTRRENTSRPTSSVPSQCAAEGGLRTARKLEANGSCGATQGAARATMMKARMTAPATRLAGWRLSRRSTRRRRPSAMAAGMAAAGALAMLSSAAGG